MTILTAPIPAPAWYRTGLKPSGRKRTERVRMLQCDCGFTYPFPARRKVPARCIHCHGDHRRKPTGWRTLRRLRPEARRAAA